jgi:hypothetical protein
MFVPVSLLLVHAGAAQATGLTSSAVLTAQRTCHGDNEDYEQLEMDIFLTNKGAQPIVLCDRRSDVPLTAALGTTAENAQAKRFVFQPNLDTFPSDSQSAREAARTRSCRKTTVPANRTILLKQGEVYSFYGLHEIPATKSLIGPMYLTGDVEIRLPGARMGEWNAISLDPLRIVFPPYDASAPRPYFNRKHPCEAWRISK